MPREVAEPFLTPEGEESHPAFGIARVSRIQAHPGHVLFDSDLRHREYMEITVSTAVRNRDLKTDWIHADEVLLMFSMSMAQYAGLISSVGTEGVPVTLEYAQGRRTKGLPFAPRLEVSMRESTEAARDAFGKIERAFAEYERVLDAKLGAKERKEALRALRAAVGNAEPNVEYAAHEFTRYAEEVVEKSRADVEAMVVRHAEKTGTPIGDLTDRMLELTGNDDPQVRWPADDSEEIR